MCCVASFIFLKSFFNLAILAERSFSIVWFIWPVGKSRVEFLSRLFQILGAHYFQVGVQRARVSQQNFATLCRRSHAAHAGLPGEPEGGAPSRTAWPRAWRSGCVLLRLSLLAEPRVHLRLVSLCRLAPMPFSVRRDNLIICLPYFLLVRLLLFFLVHQNW